MARYRPLADELAAKNAPPLLRAHLDWRVGTRLREAGDESGAYEFLVQRAELYETPNDAVANMLRLASDVSRARGDWNGALELLSRAETALAPIRETSDTYSLVAHAAWHDRRFTLFDDMGMLDAAAEELILQTELAARSKDEIAIVNAFMNRATQAVSAENWDALESMLADADAGRVQLRKRERARLELRCGVCFAEAEREGRRPPGRAEALLRGIADDEGVSPEVRLEARANLAVRLFDVGRHADAKTAMTAAHAMLATLPNPLTYRSARSQLGALRARLALASTAPDPDEMRDAREEVQALFEEQLRGWRATPPLSGGIGFLHFGYSYLLANELMRLQLASEPGEGGVRRALSVPLQLHAVGSLVRGTPARELSVATAEAALRREAGGALLYVPGRARSLVFVIDESGVFASELESWLVLELARRDLQKTVLRASRSGSPEDESAARAQAERMGRLLFPDAIETRVSGWKSLRIVGLDLTGWIPFELLKPRAGAPELGTSHAVSYVPSLHWADHLANRALSPAVAASSNFALAVGDGLPAEVRSQWSVDEIDPRGARAVVDAWGDGARLVESAGIDEVRDAFARARVGQIVAHGIYDVKRRQPAGLLFAGGSTGRHAVWTDELESIAWPELVVLSACSAQRSQLRRGDDGRASMSGSILAAGARCVVLSYADLELEAAWKLSASLARELRTGAAPDVALQRARSAPGVGFQGYLMHAVGLADRPVVDARNATAGSTGTAGATLPSEAGHDRSRWVFVLGGAGLVVIAFGVALRARRR